MSWCHTSLKQDRYTWRHNSVLNHLVTSAKSVILEGFEIYADIPSHKINGGTIPADIHITGARPDMVVINRNNKKILLIELTCPFETNIKQANTRKMIRYNDLQHDLQQIGYKTFLLPFEVGVRGHISPENKQTINKILTLTHTKINTNKVTQELGKISLLCSYIIFKASSQPEWTEPPLVSINTHSTTVLQPVGPPS